MSAPGVQVVTLGVPTSAHEAGLGCHPLGGDVQSETSVSPATQLEPSTQ